MVQDIAHTRKSGIRIFYYLDDWLLVADSPVLLRALTSLVLLLVEALGFLVILMKSHLDPSHLPEFLRASVNIPAMIACPAPHRVPAILVERATLLRDNAFSSAQRWLVFLGHLASLLDLVDHCRLRMTPFQLLLAHYFHLLHSSPSVAEPMSEEIRDILLPWTSEVFLTKGKSFSPSLPDLTVLRMLP